MRNLNLDINKIRELYEQGLSGIAIAKKLGCDKQAVYRRLREIGCSIRPSYNQLRANVDPQHLEHLYIDEGLSISEIAKSLGFDRDTIRRRLEKITSIRSPTEARKLLYKRRGYKRELNRGYIRVRQKNHPRTQRDGRIFEHILVWEQHHKQPLPKGWHIHHLNGIGTDNRPSNLVALPPAKHRERHTTLLQKRAERVRELEIENNQLRRALENSQMILYFSDN